MLRAPRSIAPLPRVCPVCKTPDGQRRDLQQLWLSATLWRLGLYLMAITTGLNVLLCILVCAIIHYTAVPSPF